MLVGLTRYQTLRYFVEFGATPVYHKPLHLLEKNELNDYIVYYDVKVPEAKSYLEQRFTRFVYQLSVMERIKKTKPIIIIARTFMMVNIIHLVYIGLQIL